MKPTLKKFDYENLDRRASVYAREGTSDVGCLAEVIDRHVYSRRRSGFDVMPGESWLDLGANIGAFAVYAYLRGAAKVTCYEPEPGCFELLQRNTKSLKGCTFELNNCAVTDREEKTLSFKKGRDENDHYRATILLDNRLPELGVLKNKFGGFLTRQKFDGVKMDIEGSEFGLIDENLLPRCEKLTLEYHFSRDHKDLVAFEKRMKLFHKRFANVWVPGFIERDLEKGVTTYSGMYDCQIFCWGPK